MAAACQAPLPPDAAVYERYGVPRGAPFTAPLLALAPPRPGARVLDLACGTGLVARAVAPGVGPAGLVIGADWSPTMVAAARALAARARLVVCRFAVMDAHALALHAAAFDMVYCALGLMLMAEPARAAAEIARVLRPGGAVAAFVWSVPEHVVAFSAYLAAVHAHVPGALPLAAHPVFRLAAPRALAVLLEGAGLVVERDERYLTTDLHADEAAYWVWASQVLGFPVTTDGSAPVMRRIVDYPAAVQTAVRADVVARLAPYRAPDGRLALPSEGVLVRAVRPAR
jgi:SAM-dependent methyltransferase